MKNGLSSLFDPQSWLMKGLSPKEWRIISLQGFQSSEISWEQVNSFADIRAFSLRQKMGKYCNFT
jgi:hypothetical protein